MIAQDGISKIVSILGLSIPIYVFLFSNINIIWLLPFFLIIGGFAIQKWLLKKPVNDVNVTSQADIGNVVFYTVICLATFIFLGLVTPTIVKLFNLEITGFDSVLFGVMMAIGEEQFFRAGWTNLLVQTSKSELYGALSSAAIFGVYHFLAYGDNPAALMFVLGAGFTFSFVDLRMNRLSPSLFGHIGNNILAYSIIGAAFVSGFTILVLAGSVGAIVYFYYRRKKG